MLQLFRGFIIIAVFDSQTNERNEHYYYYYEYTSFYPNQIQSLELETPSLWSAIGRGNQKRQHNYGN